MLPSPGRGTVQHGLAHLSARNRADGRRRHACLYPSSDHFNIRRRHVLNALQLVGACEVSWSVDAAQMKPLKKHVLIVRLKYHLEVEPVETTRRVHEPGSTIVSAQALRGRACVLIQSRWKLSSCTPYNIMRVFDFEVRSIWYLGGAPFRVR